MENIKKKLITHNGSFHADDLFACATLILVMEIENMDYEIIRTRDMESIKNADYVFDVGGIYDADTNRYDHHQRGGAGARINGIPYSSFGLIWKHFGLKLCGGNMDAWQIIDEEIVSPIDAGDNGIDIGELKFTNIKTYFGARVFSVFEPTWKEDENDTDRIFVEQVKHIVKLLKREIKVASDNVEGKKLILDFYNKSVDKRVIIFEQSLPRYLYQQVLSTLPEPVYLICPSAHGPNYKIEAVSKNPETFESRKLFPEHWRGFLNNDPKAIEVIGIEGVLFTHQSGFYAVLDNKEHAIEFAEKALTM